MPHTVEQCARMKSYDSTRIKRLFTYLERYAFFFFCRARKSAIEKNESNEMKGKSSGYESVRKCHKFER